MLSCAYWHGSGRSFEFESHWPVCVGQRRVPVESKAASFTDAEAGAGGKLNLHLLAYLSWRSRLSSRHRKARAERRAVLKLCVYAVPHHGRQGRAVDSPEKLRVADWHLSTFRTNVFKQSHRQEHLARQGRYDKFAISSGRGPKSQGREAFRCKTSPQ